MIKRVENRLENGFPDTIWTGCGRSGVWELKDWEGDDWVSKDQAIWLMNWAMRDGIGGVLAKKTRGPWLYWPAFPTFEWMRNIQHRTLAPAYSMHKITPEFINSLTPTNREKETDPRRYRLPTIAG